MDKANQSVSLTHGFDFETEFWWNEGGTVSKDLAAAEKSLMNPEMYVVICIVSFLVLSILYLCALVFCQWLFSAQSGLKLIGFGLLTTVASIGYSTIDQIAGQATTAAIHFQQNGMSTVTGTGAGPWQGVGSGTSMILCRLGVILVLSGVLSLLLEPGRKSCSGNSAPNIADPPEGLTNA